MRSLTFVLLAVLSSRLFAQPIPQREIPDFDGRDGEPTTVGDVAMWVPRAVFFPVYVVSEYGYRRPIRWLGRTLELNNVPFLVADFFKFGEEKQFAVYPSFLVDFGFRSSIGFSSRWKITPTQRLTLRAATGGTDYGIAKIGYEHLISKMSAFRVSGEIGKRPDFIFQSMGPLSKARDRYRYGAVRREGILAFNSELATAVNMDFQAAIRSIDFSNGACCGDPGIDDGIRNFVFAQPARYPDGYKSFAQRLHLNFGNRISRPTKRAGGTLDVTADHSIDLDGGGWIIYGGALAGFVDLTGLSRVISLRLDTEFSTLHEGRGIPFNELPALGGNRLPGFLDRRFVGQSAVALTVEYKWPVLSLVDGVMHFGVGNVFGKNLEGFRLGWLRKSIGFGLDATGEKSSPFGLLFAFGSRPFDEGGKFNEFRLSLRIGGNQ